MTPAAACAAWAVAANQVAATRGSPVQIVRAAARPDGEALFECAYLLVDQLNGTSACYRVIVDTSMRAWSHSPINCAHPWRTSRPPAATPPVA